MKKHIRIKIKSYDFRIIEKIILNFINIAYKNGSKIYGPISLPTKKERFTILISPHIDKDAREQYEICTYKKILDIITPNFNIIEKLMKTKLISGIYVKINIIN
ncbi:MAG: 30S ribosomal protein S10 [Enterobacteriaceae bacterium]